MRLSHLLAIGILVCLCAGIALAQSQPSNAAGAVLLQAVQQVDPSNTLETELSWLEVDPQLELLAQDSPESDASARVDSQQDPDGSGNALTQPRAHKLSTWGPLLQVNCARIRAYRVAPDSPGSDATHFVSYTTCVPAEGVSLYTAVDHGR